VVGIITSFKISPSINTHSSISPPVRLCPLEDCLAARMSIVEPFLNTYFTLSFDLVETPRSQFISLFNPGISLQISSILAIVILAACYFPPVVTNKCELGYNIHLIINAIIDKKDFEYARGNVAYTYL